jgi:exodeoxyribonuclease VII large subunit
MENEILTVSQFHNILNQTLEFAYSSIAIEGEVASFKINQGKWVFFDIKDDSASLGCFMPIFQLKTAIEDGMLVRVVCRPQVTVWGKFSLNIQSVELVGEGSVKKAFELMRAQFEKEGLFAADRKRALPTIPRRVALITSAQAAAYNDFLTVLTQRYCAIEIVHLQVQVQGDKAPDQIVRAIEYCNDHSETFDVVVLIRGGGSADDLQAFNTEPVVRAVYASQVPTLVGIGHEDDVSLAEMAADMRAATPTDAARRLSPELQTIYDQIEANIHHAYSRVLGLHNAASHTIHQLETVIARIVNQAREHVFLLKHRADASIDQIIHQKILELTTLSRSLNSLDPRAVLRRGYSIATVNGAVVTKSSQIKQNSLVVLQLHQGTAQLTKLKANATNTGVTNHGHSQSQIKF